MSDLNSRHHTEMHGFVIGSIVIENSNMCPAVASMPLHKRPTYIVVGIGGNYKDDHIQLDSTKSAWEIAGHYLEAPEVRA